MSDDVSHVPLDTGDRGGTCVGGGKSTVKLPELYAELRRACAEAGGQKHWADRKGVSEQYLSDVLNARKEPGPLILEALGLRRVVSYERRTSNVHG